MSITEAVHELGAGEVFAPNGLLEDDGPLNCGYHYGYCQDPHPILVPPRCLYHSDEDAEKPRSGDPRRSVPLCAECAAEDRQGL
jgi:hypothetical protein